MSSRSALLRPPGRSIRASCWSRNARSSAGRCPSARKMLGTKPDFSAITPTRSRRSSGSSSSSVTPNLLTFMRGLLSGWRRLARLPAYDRGPGFWRPAAGMLAGMAATHEVTNQPPPLVGYDASADQAMLGALDREGGGWAVEEVRRLGRVAGGAHDQE